VPDTVEHALTGRVSGRPSIFATKMGPLVRH
jgi:hypothetical protein